jgi:hypothetical protein
MVRSLGVVFAAAAVVLAAAGLGSAADEKKAVRTPAPDKAATFAMREVSAFAAVRQPGRNAYTIARGQTVQCGSEPDRQVKAYPKLKSNHPLYGKVRFGATRLNPDAGVEYQFVIDESGEKPAESKSGHSKPGDAGSGGSKLGAVASFVNELASSLLGEKSSTGPASPIVQPSAPPISYDRLYFDANHDLDLTNDPVLLPMKDPPAAANPFASQSKQTVVYDYLAIPFDYGPGQGRRSFRVLPRLMIQEYEGTQYVSLCFVAAVARQGQIRIGSQEYDAVLAQPYSITGRFNLPSTAMFLTRVGATEPQEYWWGSDEIGAMRRVDGRYYATSVTPLGDKLTVKPYQGDFGTLKLGPGKRDLKKLVMKGSLRSETTSVAVGDPGGRGWPDAKATTECSIPVGDYVPAWLSIEYGRLRINLSDNYHSDGHPRDTAKMAKRRTYAFKIRKDQSFVLDFSHKPEVLFASPAKDQTLKPGDTLSVAAVLVDPVLDIMIRGLDDSGRTEKVPYKLPGGKEQSFQRPLSLDPKVTITNSSGKRVAEGKLPFG